jgi:hypothetical protein
MDLRGDLSDIIGPSIGNLNGPDASTVRHIQLVRRSANRRSPALQDRRDIHGGVSQQLLIYRVGRGGSDLLLNVWRGGEIL